MPQTEDSTPPITPEEARMVRAMYFTAAARQHAWVALPRTGMKVFTDANGTPLALWMPTGHPAEYAAGHEELRAFGWMVGAHQITGSGHPRGHLRKVGWARDSEGKEHSMYRHQAFEALAFAGLPDPNAPRAYVVHWLGDGYLEGCRSFASDETAKAWMDGFVSGSGKQGAEEGHCCLHGSASWGDGLTSEFWAAAERMVLVGTKEFIDEPVLETTGSGPVVFEPDVGAHG